MQFIVWTKRKIYHHFFVESKEIFFREREVWWATLGKNVGYEIDGKHEYFSRPVLIVKKYSGEMCFVLPLTTQIKEGSPPYQFKLCLSGKLNAINLSQGKTISAKRLMQKIEKIDEDVFLDVLDKFIKLLIK